MRNYLYILLAAILFCGCAKDEFDEEKIPVADKSFTWDTSISEQDIVVRASGDWTLKSDVSWCEPRQTSGSGKSTVNLWVEPNLTDTEREGTLVVKTDGKIQQIKLTQPACDNPDNYVYQLPVIFHVLYKDKDDTKQYVRKGWMKHVLDSVNMIYRDNGVNVQFQLAQYDEKNNKLDEAGVMRHQVDFDQYDCYKFISAEDTGNRKYGDYNQNLRRFINIYIFRFTEDNIAGISCMPLMPKGYELDSLLTNDFFNKYHNNGYPWGCCINNNYIYQTSNPVYYSTPIYKTLSHELGHYLGLLHPFSTDECNEDDACADTPIYDRDAYIRSVQDYISGLRPGETGELRVVIQRSECETGNMFEARNVMDYDYCYNNKFTQEQNARIKYVLNYAQCTPGPKLFNPTTTRSSEPEGPLPVKIQRCPPVIISPVQQDTCSYSRKSGDW
jgi:zinc-dependent metalloproteinase lipoprotein